MNPGTKVALKARPDRQGVVMNVDGELATVFWVSGRQELVNVGDLTAAASKPSGGTAPSEMLAHLTARRLAHPLSDQLMSYRASRTKMFPHQFIPVRKIVEDPASRVLIADEVGTGKTIEAGLIWAELDARQIGGLATVLVVCPKALVEKWQSEFSQRFDLKLAALDSKGMKEAMAAAKRDGVLPPRFAHAVGGLQMLRATKFLKDIEEADLQWDLVIIDEAHHMKTPSSNQHALGRLLGQRAKAMVLLTATPVQTSLDDLRNLYRILGVGLADESDVFREELEVDMALNDLLQMARNGAPDWQRNATAILDSITKRRAHLRDSIAQLTAFIQEMNPRDAASQVELRERVRELQAFSPFTTRTMRKDIDETRPMREAHTLHIDFTETQRAFYDAVYEAAMDRAEEMGVPTGFVAQMPERRAASSAPAMAKSLLKDKATPDTLLTLARGVLEETDPKAEQLLEAIKDLMAHDHKQVIVFSTFRDTLEYLEEILTRNGYTSHQVHGDTPQRDADCKKGQTSREAIAANFRAGDFQVLLASEVASEGLDFQFCAALINYDLPWNPMRIEQRIGRIDRIGQESPKIAVLNLATTGTVEHRILVRLYERLEVFERALGDMEMILGDEMEEFRKDLFSKKLSPTQQEERLERVARAMHEKRRQQDLVEDEHGELLGAVQRVEVDREEFKQMTARFLDATHLERFVMAELRHAAGDGSVLDRGNGLFRLQVSHLKEALGALSKALPGGTTQAIAARQWRQRAAKDDEQIDVQFHSPEYEPGQEFIHVRHPLVLLARHLYDRRVRAEEPALATGVLSVDCGLEVGSYVCGWGIVSYNGLMPQVHLREVLLNERGEPVPLDRGRTATELLSSAAPADLCTNSLAQLIESLPRRVAESAEEKQDEHRVRNERAVARARASLIRSSEGERTWRKEQLENPALDPGLARMHQGRLDRLDRERDERLEELERKGMFQVSREFIGAAVLRVGN